ncbi:MAG: 1-(5-phosphoribosyl)-5-[(5-phosphoribosylamino)methylideneamino]imidazole-4-carboxamide isomerase [Alphaproteobacteria bacterium]|nr:1-(5-phosphoribosyl)-5-[(5-phosphoribosylamino)methylideneamino]imidazole-4-carboxamide isomerase [Alphaproteobacteria bacterium]
MILYPAIDLKDGRCVRLEQGAMDRATVYNEDPAAQALAFAEAGFEWLHVVDLDGAVAGRPVNQKAVEAVVAAVDLPIQLGGGIRNMATLEGWLEAGVARIVLGTVALTDPDLVVSACRAFPGKIAVAIDARKGLVATQGWTEVSEITALQLAVQFENVGVTTIIYTDIDRDGILKGVNAKAAATLARAIPMPVIVSGGVASIADIETLIAVMHTGIRGVICGRALYDGRLNPAEALALVAQAR